MKNAQRTRADLDLVADGLPPSRPFTTHEAYGLGLSPESLTELVQAGLLRRPVRGVYVRAALPDTLELRAAALRLVVPAGAFVCDRTAAWLHGASSALAPGDHTAVPELHVFRVPSRTRLRNGIVAGGRRSVTAADLCEVDGLVTTTPLRTALDLGRLQQRDLALAGMDALAHLGLVTAAELIASVGRFRGARGVVQLRHLAPLVDPGAASPGESALRLRWIDAGLPRPTCQVPVDREDGRHFYLDLGLPDDLFGAEYDGAAWHGPDRAEHDDARRLWLRTERGWRLEVFTAAHVYGADQDADLRLRRAWAGHRRRAAC